MLFFKQIVVGILGAVAAALVYVAGVVLLAMWQQDAFAGEGAGGFGFVVSVIPVIGVAAVGFIVGFTWMRRRSRRKA